MSAGTPMGGVAGRLAELGIELPPLVPAAPDHATAVRVGNMLYMSGNGPLDARRVPVFKGKVGADLTEADGYAAARLTALNILRALQHELGDLDRIKRVVRITGYVNVAPDFERMPWVVNGASEVFKAVFGERGDHARSTLGVASLALGMACVIESVFEVE